MVKVWLFGFMFYLLGVACLRVRVHIEARENPDFITKFMEAYEPQREDSLAIGAPYIAAIFPGLNFICGVILIVITMSNKYWSMLIEDIIDKK